MIDTLVIAGGGLKGFSMISSVNELIKNKINVIMIEPQPECIKVLNELYSTNPLVTIVPKGLGRSNQKMEM